jgi:hypothetical protein
MTRLIAALAFVLLASPAFAQDTIEVKHQTFTPITFGATAPADLTTITEFRLSIDGVTRASLPVGAVTPGAAFEWAQLPALSKGSHTVFCEAIGMVDGVEVASRCINPTSLMVNVEGPASPTGLGKKK